MTEEQKERPVENKQQQSSDAQPKQNGPAQAEQQTAAAAPPQTGQPPKGPAGPGQSRPPQRSPGSPAGNQPPRPLNRPPMQGNRPPGGQYRPQGPSSGQGSRPPSGQPGAPRPAGPPPQTQTQGDAQQQSGPGAPRPAQPGATRQPIDWLRSKPVPGGSRPQGSQRGLDLGRPDAWSGRQKPPTPGTGPQRPPSTDQRPAGPGGPARPQGSGAPYRGTRPQGPGGPYQGRPPGAGFGAPRPGGARPGGFRPAGAPATTWGKGTETSRRARSGRKGKEKERERPALEEDVDARGVRRTVGGATNQRASAGKPSLLKSKLETAAPELGKAVIVPAHMTVKDLADVLNISSVEIIKELMKSGIMAPVNQVIDFDTASIVASDLGFEIRQAEAPAVVEATPVAAPDVVVKRPTTIAEMLKAEDPANLAPRPPVVTIMGHVDHGKTSLLDAIRRTNVAGGEFGGITQHIGAYQVEDKNQKITFLDTPGHEAFTAMRARGAQVTDIAIVVVAADDGVQPQTLEAINHARAAGVPIVVALNKVDKDTANPERVKQQLADAGLVPEDWGGNTVVVPVSAKKGTGVSDLLDMILLVAEMASLKANPNREAVGTIIEAEMDKSKGPMATVLVQNGTLNVGDYVAVGSIHGKIKALFNDKGKAIRKAPPSTPASILGLSDVPQSGDILRVFPDEHQARSEAELEKDRAEGETTTAAVPPIDLERLSSMIAAGMVKELDIVLKVDVQGSLEPIANSLKKMGDDKVQVRLLHQATGMITESDVSLAAAARAAAASKAAMVIGFNVEPDPAAKRTAEIQGVEIRTFKVIYDIVDAIDKALKGLYEPKYQEVVDAHAEVRQVFKLSKGVTIAGSIVSDGTIVRGAQARLRRNDAVIFDGKIGTLRRFKDDVRDVASGFECGITIDGFNEIQEKDIIETYHKERMN